MLNQKLFGVCVCVYEKKGREATRAPDSFFSTGALGALNDF